MTVSWYEPHFDSRPRSAPGGLRERLDALKQRVREKRGEARTIGHKKCSLLPISSARAGDDAMTCKDDGAEDFTDESEAPRKKKKEGFEDQLLRRATAKRKRDERMHRSDRGRSRKKKK